MKTPSGVIFDFGDTVMHEEAFSLLDGYTRLFEFASSPTGVTPQEALVFSSSIAEEVNKLKRETMIETSLQSFLRLVFDYLGVSLNLSYAEMESEFWEASVVHRPSEGIFDVLDLLDANGIRSGILSNAAWSGAVLLKDLAKHNLAHRFSFLISSADYGLRKPSRHIFQVAIKKMGLPADKIWFVGDRLDNDVAGAINSGLFPVWYNPKNRPRVPEFECLEVKGWSEFGERIESLVG